MIDQPPESLVRGCNDSVAIGVLSDWIEEQYGIALDLDRSGWDFHSGYGEDYEKEEERGNGYGYGYCNGAGQDFFCNGKKYHAGDGSGNGRGLFYGGSYGNGYGSGFGHGCNYGHGCGDGNGTGAGGGNGYLRNKVYQ